MAGSKLTLPSATERRQTATDSATKYLVAVAMLKHLLDEYHTRVSNVLISICKSLQSYARKGTACKTHTRHRSGADSHTTTDPSRSVAHDRNNKLQIGHTNTATSGQTSKLILPEYLAFRVRLSSRVLWNRYKLSRYCSTERKIFCTPDANVPNEALTRVNQTPTCRERGYALLSAL